MSQRSPGKSRPEQAKTDRSLKDEREKTDVLLEATETVEEKTDEAILLNRSATDLRRETERLKTDEAVDENEKSSSADLRTERKKSDELHSVERQEEDQLRNQERQQKNLLAEILLDTERVVTDRDLERERTAAEQSIQDSRHQLLGEQESHRSTKDALTTRDQFLAIVSHDLKNPLGAITMTADLTKNALSEKQIDKEDLLRLVDVIERNAANMERMIGDLLDVERMANGKLHVDVKTHEVKKLFAECRDLFAPIAEAKGIHLIFRQEKEDLRARFDADRILQVLSNILGNALKFTPSGGEIEVSASQKESSVIFCVRDTGPGIPKEKIASIFERFSQLQSKDRRGLGLGLFIAKWIIEAHDSAISVESTPDKGSLFSFPLPSAP